MTDPDQYKMVLFDLDGTLVDSVPDLAWCGDEMMRQLGLPARGIESARCWVGNGVERFVKRFLTNSMLDEPPTELFDRGFQLFDRLYTDNVCQYSELYEGVLEGLESLKKAGLHLACVTNKAERFSTRLVGEIGLKQYFNLVVSGDTTSQKKPHPMPLLFAAKHYSCSPADCLMVGDSSNDVAAARAAGFAVACVPYGYNHGEDIADSNPDFIIESINQLPSILEPKK
ncbi:MAG: phosphoglycolate phosphatase [Gammaproteobacteria bacterium]|jgi:phosphoglycolate phosphatase